MAQFPADLQQKCRFANARIFPDQNRTVTDQSTTQNCIQLADAGFIPGTGICPDL